MRESHIRTLPYFTSGTVVKGFGRGSKELGIPTANYPDDVVKNLPEDISTGIYYGWAQVDRKPVEKMVISIGWNPFYHNVKKSMETYIIKEYDGDFYGSTLRVAICGFIRQEQNFDSLDELIQAIHSDIAFAKKTLEMDPEMEKLKTHLFFLQPLINSKTER